VIAPVGFQGETKRRFYYFDTKTGAQDFCKTVNVWRHNRKNPQLGGEIKIEQSDTGMVALLRSYGIQSAQDLAEILSQWKRTNAVTKVGLRDAIQTFLAYFKTNDKPSQPYLLDVQGKLNNFAADLPGLEVHQIDRKDLIDYLSDFENAGSRNQWLKRFRLFFKWATNERYISVNPVESIDWAKVDSRDCVEIYTAGDVSNLLNTADKQFPELLPWVALQVFGYCRSAEVQKLDWSAIDFESGIISVSASISKTNRRRSPAISDQLREWLTPHRKASGPVVGNLNGDITRLFTAAGVTRLHNGLRHTCCSVAAAALGETVGLTRICQFAGHSLGIARKHYWEAMTPAQAEAYLAIKREG
jgi:site-specific recombinase XerD